MPRKHNLTDEKWSPPSMIEWETFGRVGDDSAGEAFHKISNVPVTTRVAADSTDATLTYIGVAVPGTLTSVAKWQITRVDGSGNELFANGDSLFDNEFDEREALAYS